MKNAEKTMTKRENRKRCLPSSCQFSWKFSPGGKIVRPKPTDPPMVRIVLSKGQQRWGGGVGTKIVSQNLKYLKNHVEIDRKKIILHWQKRTYIFIIWNTPYCDACWIGKCCIENGMKVTISVVCGGFSFGTERYCRGSSHFGWWHEGLWWWRWWLPWSFGNGV